MSFKQNSSYMGICKKKKMSKKADGFMAFESIVYMAYVVMIVASVAILLGLNSDNKNNVDEEFENWIVDEQLLNNVNCFAYQDYSGRIYSSEVDVDKFHTGRIDDCLNLDEINQAYRVVLEYNNGEEKIIESREWYDERFDVSKLNTVLVHDNNEVFIGTLRIERKRI